MTFADLLDQALAMLQRHGRVTYQTFRLQFQLDDAYLAALKEQLLYAHPQVVDDEGRGLVWTAEWSAPEPEAQPEREVELRCHALLPAVIGLLRGEGRLTYRALKHVFSIDNRLLREIREELTFRRLAIDENGKGLVWTGEMPPIASPVVDVPHPPAITDTRAGDESPAVPPLPPCVTETPTPSNGPTGLTEGICTETLQDKLAVPPEPIRNLPEAERRQLTVMFCDLVGSTDLSGRLDPEDLREVVRAYQETAAKVIERYGGHIAQYLGDGLLIYFGFPLAHEDDAQRSIYTGLEIPQAMSSLNTRLEADYGVRLSVRIGIHTGPVVVGEMGGGGRHENLALGETPNIAARLEGLAPANAVVISPVTAQLVRRSFVLEELGLHDLKGVADPMMLYTVAAPQTSDDADGSGVTGGFEALVGRDEEIGLLLRRWEQSKDGLGQVVLVSGEAGIGKSSLVEGLRRHVREEGLLRIAFRCSPYHSNSVLYPIVEHVQRGLGWQQEDTADTQLAKLEQGLRRTSLPLDETVPLLASLLSLPLPEGRYPPLTLSPQQQRQQTQDVLVAWLLEEAEHQAVLTVWEDLHWADPSTLETLGLLMDQAPTATMMHVLTCRPEFEPPWPTRSHLTPITLNRLERSQVEALVTRLSGNKKLPAEVVEHIVTKTDGVPLFVEELTKMLLASDLLRETSDHYELTGPLLTVAIPDTLQDSLMARLDQMNTAKDVAQLGAVLGREFPYAMLQAITSQDDETLQAGLAKLVEAELLYQRGRPPRARYIFKHALIQDAAYAALLKSTRQRVHQQIAQVLETRFPEMVESQPEMVAHHALQGEVWDKALTYYRQAGARARIHSANREAVTCFEQALQTLRHLPENRNTMEQAIDLRFDLRNAFLSLGEIEHILDNLRVAERVAETLNDQSRLGWVSTYMTNYFYRTGGLERGIPFGQRALALATASGDRTLEIAAQFQLGLIYQGRGDYGNAIERNREIITALHEGEIHELFGLAGFASVLSRHTLVSSLAEQGAFTEGLAFGGEGMEIAEAANHPDSLVRIYLSVGYLYLCKGELSPAIEVLERGLDVIQTMHVAVGFPAVAALLGCAYARSGRVNEGLPLLEQSVHQGAAMRVMDYQSLGVTYLSEAYLLANRVNEANVQAQHAFDLAYRHQERGRQAHALRLLGDCAAQANPSDLDQAKTYYHQALTLANELGMRPLQAHCHRGLGTLYCQTGQAEQARAELTTAIDMYREMEMAAWLTKSEVALAEVNER